MASTAQTFFRQLTLRYVIALALVAALSVGSYVALASVIRAEAERAGQINLSGRQRMLSQRIALDSHVLGDLLSTTRRAQVRRDLAGALDAMRRAHETLVSGGTRAGDTGLDSERLRGVYFGDPAQTDRRVRFFLRDGQAVLRRSASILPRGDPSQSAVLAAARGPLLESLNRAVTSFEQESASDVRRLERISNVVLAVTLGVLLLEGLFVFRPLVRQVRRRTEKLAAAEARLRAVVEHAPVGVLTLDGAGVVLSANAAAASIFDRGTETLQGLAAPCLVEAGSDRDSLATLIAAAALAGALPARELAVRHAEGHLLTTEVTVTPARTHHELTLVMLITDVTDRKTHEAELCHRALHDTLTRLPNRVLLVDRLVQAQARLGRNGGQLALLFIDLDGFKVVNDRLGHAAGDRLLVIVARRFEELLRSTDTLARFGGDEFIVLCDGSSGEEAIGVADRMLAALDGPIGLPGNEQASVGASIGITLAVAGDGQDPEAIIAKADAAMYRAKRRGGGYELVDAEVSPTADPTVAEGALSAAAGGSAGSGRRRR